MFYNVCYDGKEYNGMMACHKPPVPEANQREWLVGHLGSKAVERLEAQVYLSHPLDKTFQQLKEGCWKYLLRSGSFERKGVFSTDGCALL
jgi:hypothetical protein